MPPRIHALLLLAGALISTFFRNLFGAKRGGLRLFHANYAADRLPPVTVDERERMGSFGRCIACGLCDRGEAERVAASGGEYRGVMALVIAGARSMPDYRATARSAGHVSDEVLADKERLCPTEVPIVDIVRFVRAKAAESESMVAAALPAAE